MRFSFQVVVISYSCVIILGNFKVFRAVQSEQQGSNHEQGLKSSSKPSEVLPNEQMIRSLLDIYWP